LVLGSGHAAIYHLPDPLDGSVQLGQEGSFWNRSTCGFAIWLPFCYPDGQPLLVAY